MLQDGRMKNTCTCTGMREKREQERIKCGARRGGGAVVLQDGRMKNEPPNLLAELIFCAYICRHAAETLGEGVAGACAHVAAVRVAESAERVDDLERGKRKRTAAEE